MKEGRGIKGGVREEAKEKEKRVKEYGEGEGVTEGMIEGGRGGRIEKGRERE